MLILSRKTNQSLVIGESIEITVVEVRDGHVRLGISAPRTVPVYRKELIVEVAAENLEAAATAQISDVAANPLAGSADPGKPRVAVLEPSGPTLHNRKGG
jgi:carbon storage regulator